MNYTELASEVPRILMAENSELTAFSTFADVVRRAHDQLVGLLDHDAFATSILNERISETGRIDLSALTPRVFEIRSMGLIMPDGSRRPVLPRGYEVMTTLFPAGTTGLPLFYASVAPLVVQVFPRPTAVAYVDLQVNREPPVASAATPDTVLTRDYARAHDAVVLRHAALFMKDWESADRYTAELTAALAEVNPQVARRRRDETTQRPRATENVSGA